MVTFSSAVQIRHSPGNFPGKGVSGALVLKSIEGEVRLATDEGAIKGAQSLITLGRKLEGGLDTLFISSRPLATQKEGQVLHELTQRIDDLLTALPHLRNAGMLKSIERQLRWLYPPSALDRLYDTKCKFLIELHGRIQAHIGGEPLSVACATTPRVAGDSVIASRLRSLADKLHSTRR